jgi:hypothetical protein
MGVSISADGVGTYIDCQCGGITYEDEEVCDLCGGTGKMWKSDAPEIMWTYSSFGFIFNIVLGYQLDPVYGSMPLKEISDLRRRILRMMNRPSFPGCEDMPMGAVRQRLTQVDHLAQWCQNHGKDISWA